VIDTIALGGVLIVIACLAFVGSIRLGMLVGQRIDRRIEAGPEDEPAPEVDDIGATARPTATRSQDLGGPNR
jgi:hypothetical protein